MFRNAYDTGKILFYRFSFVLVLFLLFLNIHFFVADVTIWSPQGRLHQMECAYCNRRGRIFIFFLCENGLNLAVLDRCYGGSEAGKRVCGMQGANPILTAMRTLRQHSP